MSNVASGNTIAGVAALIGDPARANMLSALMGGLALTAGELARHAGVTAQTASGHLARLADAELIALDLAAGRLARPFEPAIETAPRHAYHIVTASEVAEDSPAAAFRDWVLSEAKKTSAAKSSETGC